MHMILSHRRIFGINFIKILSVERGVLFAICPGSREAAERYALSDS
jgi:hypothetical protein